MAVIPADVKKLDKIVKQLVQFFDPDTPILIIGIQKGEIGTIGNVSSEDRPEFLRHTADALEIPKTHGNN